RGAADAGVVDRQVQRTEVLDRARDRRLHLGRVGNIADVADGPAAIGDDRVDHAPHGIGLEVGHDHRHAIGGKQVGDGFADAGGSTGDKGGRAGKRVRPGNASLVVDGEERTGITIPVPVGEVPGADAGSSPCTARRLQRHQGADGKKPGTQVAFASQAVTGGSSPYLRLAIRNAAYAATSASSTEAVMTTGSSQTGAPSKAATMRGPSRMPVTEPASASRNMASARRKETGRSLAMAGSASALTRPPRPSSSSAPSQSPAARSGCPSSSGLPRAAC